MADTPQNKVFFIFTKSAAWAKENILASIIVGVVLGWLTTWLFTRTPHLYRTVSDPFPYKSEADSFATFSIKISNDGSASVEEVHCEFDIPDCKIREVLASPTLYKPVAIVQPDGIKATIDIPRLNPGNQVDVFVRTDLKEDLKKSLNIGLTAKGYDGDDKPISKTPLRQAFNFLISSLFWGIITFTIMYCGVQEGKKQYEKELMQYVAKLFGVKEEEVKQIAERFIQFIIEQAKANKIELKINDETKNPAELGQGQKDETLPS